MEQHTSETNIGTPVLESQNGLTTLSIFTFPKGKRFWAFSQMGLARPLLKKVPGLSFVKLMGTARGEVFSIRPDWSRYALLGVWKGQEEARHFLNESAFIRRYSKNAAQTATIFMKPLSAHGKWDGVNPFGVEAGTKLAVGTEIGVLTRATIRPLKLSAFLKQAPIVSRIMVDTPGLKWSIGIGEAPFLKQATFSLWNSQNAFQKFAYHTPEHRQAIALTRSLSWYREELFSRFLIVEKVNFPF